MKSAGATLLILVSAFVVSCLLYQAGMLSFAGAEAAKSEGKKVEKGEKAEAAKKQSTASLRELRQSLQERLDNTKKKEVILEKRASELKDKESILNQQIGRYEKVIQELKLELKKKAERENEKTRVFRQIYEKMDPKKSAKIFDRMNLTLAIDILAGMRSTRAAEVLGQMDSKRASLITEKFLGVKLNKLPRRQPTRTPTQKTNTKGGEI